jgi:hypothetical protein
MSRSFLTVARSIAGTVLKHATEPQQCRLFAPAQSCVYLRVLPSRGHQRQQDGKDEVSSSLDTAIIAVAGTTGLIYILYAARYYIRNIRGSNHSETIRPT